MEIQTQELTEIKSQVLGVQQAAQALVVNSVESMNMATELLSNVSKVEKFITNRKEEITRPLMKSLASLRDLFKPLELGHADAKKTIKAKMLAYQIEEEDRIQKEKDKITKRVEKGTMRADTAVSKLENVGEAPKSNMRETKKVRVIDETAIPREYMVPNLIAITEAILRKNETIPGVEMYIEKSIVAR